MNSLTKKYSVGLIGGDMRMEILANIVKNNGYPIKIYAISHPDRFNGDDIACTLDGLFATCDLIILPVPVTRDKVNIFAENTACNVNLNEVIRCSSNFGPKIIFGGIIPAATKETLQYNNHTVIDIFDNARLIENNAVATAEGALMIAMENLQTTITGTKFAVLGFGRIASHLSKILNDLGGEVTVFARRDDALLKARNLGYDTVKLEEQHTEEYALNIACELDRVSLIFNTVPSVILKREIIAKMKCRPLYVELASSPYGMNSKDARELEFNTLYAPSLPGRYSPVSAANYIFEAICSSLSSMES